MQCAASWRNHALRRVQATGSAAAAGVRWVPGATVPWQPLSLPGPLQVLPFILRRTKEAVLAELPPKIIQDVLCPASALQAQLLQAFQQSSAAAGISDSVAQGANAQADKKPTHVFQASWHRLPGGDACTSACTRQARRCRSGPACTRAHGSPALWGSVQVARRPGWVEATRSWPWRPDLPWCPAGAAVHARPVQPPAAGAGPCRGGPPGAGAGPHGHRILAGRPASPARRAARAQAAGAQARTSGCGPSMWLPCCPQRCLHALQQGARLPCPALLAGLRHEQGRPAPRLLQCMTCSDVTAGTSCTSWALACRTWTAASQAQATACWCSPSCAARWTWWLPTCWRLWACRTCASTARAFPGPAAASAHAQGCRQALRLQGVLQLHHLGPQGLPAR